jgi:DNA-binding NtrC family response regulator
LTAVTLLLVEDDIVDRTAVKRALKTAGVEAIIREVEDTDAALAILQHEPIDCVLLDYRLPKSDGLELLKRAREIGLSTPFIVLTGQGDEQLAAEMMRSGASDYLPKHSLTPDRLERALRHAWRSPGPRRNDDVCSPANRPPARRRRRPIAPRTNSWRCCPTNCARR